MKTLMLLLILLQGCAFRHTDSDRIAGLDPSEVKDADAPEDHYMLRALFAAMKGMGDGLKSQQNQPVTCTSYKLGNSVQTQCQ